MHQVDPLRGDDALKSTHVEAHRKRVLGRRGKLDEEAADRLQFSRELAGIPMQPARPRAGLGQRSGQTASVARSSPPASTGGTI